MSIEDLTQQLVAWAHHVHLAPAQWVALSFAVAVVVLLGSIARSVARS